MVDWADEYTSRPRGTFEKLLRSWKPIDPDDGRSLPNLEGAWRRSLSNYLSERFGTTDRVRIVRDYGLGVRRVDLGLERKRWGSTLGRKPVVDCVEIKRGLNRSKFSDLHAEIEGVKGTDHWTFAIICGPEKSIEPHWRDELKKRYTLGWNDELVQVAVFLKLVESRREQKTRLLLSTIESD